MCEISGLVERHGENQVHDHDECADEPRRTAGEWSKTRQFLTQFQNVEPNNVDQFCGGSKQPILWPPEYKTGEMIYPYENARGK